MKKKTPWPTAKAMEQIYDLHLWGGKEFDFYSGEGSHHPKIVQPYLSVVTTVLQTFKQPPIICDLGCGDFNIGKHFVRLSKYYIGIDIVANLINRNKNKFVFNNLEFQCLDIAKDSLPKANVLIIRQVLQHLSNKEIIDVVKKMYNYSYVILTEHLPLGTYNANLDIISGQGIRLKKNSGVHLLKAPFCLKVKKETELLSVVTNDKKGKIVTTLLEI